MQIHPLTGRRPFVFPSVRSALRPLSNAALLAALRRMGYEQGTVTVYGFRSTASTLLNEMGQNRDWIERQLAHGERDGVRASYNYADYLPQRRVMMQLWADYLDQLRTSRVAMGGEQLTLDIPWLPGGGHCHRNERPCRRNCGLSRQCHTEANPSACQQRIHFFLHSLLVFI